MGLPQVTTGAISEEVAASLSTFVQSPQRFIGLNSYEMSGMHGANAANWIPGNLSRSSIGDFQRRSMLDIPKESDAAVGYKDNSSYVNTLKIDHTDQIGRFSNKNGRSTQNPLFRIVGFESSTLSSSTNVFQDNQANSQTAVSTICNAAEVNGPSARKRGLSPLNVMLLQDQFNDDKLDIDGSIYQRNLQARDEHFKVSLLQEHKKAHIGSSNGATWNVSASPQRKIPVDDGLETDSSIFIDGPLLGNQQLLPGRGNSSQSGLSSFLEARKLRSQNGQASLSSERMVSSSLSLSPLGPKLDERVQIARDLKEETPNKHITLKDVEHSLNGSVSGLYSERNGEGFIMEESNIFKNEDEFFTPEIPGPVGRYWSCDTTPTSPTLKFCRTLSGLSVKRSLIGSFEESLLSGRLVCGSISKKIDGFLAVLSITGGSFSPKPHKLPFAVTSVDGDKYLLYYSSIDLGRHKPLEKPECARLKRSLSVDDTPSEKNRLRIPMKGRLQLVSGFSWN
ncbi:hypothetical protein Ancab_035528 [Ancistrocladus abbreviatus]